MAKSRAAVAAIAYPATKYIIGNLLLAIALTLLAWQAWPAQAQTLAPFYYPFNSAGVLLEAGSLSLSTSPYFWLEDGGSFAIANGVGSTQPGGTQFMLLTKNSSTDGSAQAYFNRVRDNIADGAQPYYGESIVARYADNNNYYYAGLRDDGYAVIKKKTNGVYQTLATKKIYAGTWSASLPDVLPHNKWMGLKLSVATNSAGNPVLTLSTDLARSGTWTAALSVTDDPAKYGSPISSGLMGVQNDHADIQIDDFAMSSLSSAPPIAQPLAGGTSPAPSAPSSNYDSTVLAAKPSMYLTMSSASSGSEADKSGHNLNGTYKGGAPASASLPNGDKAADFNGSSQYLTVPSNSSLSISTQKQLTWEAWIRPDTLQFANASGDGYVDWMGKCADYSPTCEWEARMYSASTAEGRPNRLSAYVFNPSAGLGSAADWQPSTGVINQGQWIHVVAEYDTTATPSGCSSAYPGSINIWVNGVKQNFAAHAPTGCMSQFSIKPTAGNSPLNIGTMALDTWFKGAVGKVAVYNRLLSQSEINSHYTAMTGKTPTGSCSSTCSF